jgi:ABC-type antimicrobial peptide transport system permease subunit
MAHWLQPKLDMDRLQFFLRHAVAHLRRERQRTLFVLFCISAGVAAVVSLRTMGLMVSDALARDLQLANRGDIAIGMPSRIDEQRERAAESDVDRSLFDVSGDPAGNQTISLSRSGEVRLKAWASSCGLEAMPFWTNGGPFARVYKAGNQAVAESIRILCVDPTSYPFYGNVQIIIPAETDLAHVLSEPYALAASDELAEELQLEIGDQVHLAGAPTWFNVTAIVDRKSEASLNNVLATVFPFAYVPYETCTKLLHKRPNVYYLRLPAGADVHAAKEEILAQFPGLQPTTTEDLRQANRAFSDTLLRLVTVMGLASLLIGGIGIANTMTVVVSRRMLEIGVLKTVGVQAHQITLMFMVEALILGAVGSVLGIPLGLGLVVGLRTFAERFVGQTVQFAVYPEALGMGLVLGLTVTVVFGLLPTLSAGRVRPGVVLGPAQAALPRAGRVLSLLTVTVLTGIMGLIAGQILGDLASGLLAAYAIIVILGLVMVALRTVIWLVSHFPSFGIVSLKLSLRAMGAQKGRATSTLLALVVGILCLGLVWTFVQGTRQLVSDLAPTFLGGNVLVTIHSREVGRALERRLSRIPGVTFKHDTVHVAEIVAINGNRDMEGLKRQASVVAGGALVVGDPETLIHQFVSAFDMKVLDENTWSYQVAEGTDIAGEATARASAASRSEILLEPDLNAPVYAWFGLKPGDVLTLRFPGGATRQATIAGITAPHNVGFLLQGLLDLRATHSIVQPRFVPSGEPPQPSTYVLEVPHERMNETMDLLAAMPGIYMVATEEFVVYTERYTEQFVPLPLIVSAQALFAGCVIIANAVSLSTLERRREIGIMKALGVQSESVLGLLLLENGLVGLVGGLLGAGLSALLILLSGSLGEQSIPSGALLLLVLLAVGLTLGASMLTAYGASRERPLHVLRYE